MQATPTPTQETAVTATPTPELINMEETVEKNVMGEKTSTASKVTIVNKTGSEVAAIYVRETPSDDSEDDEWGDDLVNGMFTLKNGENAVYYYEKGSSSVTYDIRITYSDEEKNECFFRTLPLTTMKQITLRMDGSGDDSIPYATYLTASSTKEVSTLNDVGRNHLVCQQMIQTVILLQHRPRRIHQMIPVQVILQIPTAIMQIRKYTIPR